MRESEALMRVWEVSLVFLIIWLLSTKMKIKRSRTEIGEEVSKMTIINLPVGKKDPNKQNTTHMVRQIRGFTWAEKPGRVLAGQADAATWVGLECREIWASICPEEDDGWTMVTGGLRPLFLGGNKYRDKRLKGDSITEAMNQRTNPIPRFL